MKILYHHRIRSKDGQFVHVEELTNALRRYGHEIIFVGPRVIENDKLGADAGFVAWMKKHLPQFIYELMELCYSFLDIVLLIKAIRQHKPDCLYERYNLLLPSGVWASKLFSLPMLLEVNAPLFEERQKYDGIALPALAQYVERYTWRGADFVLPVTEVLAKKVEQSGVPRDRICVIHNGIDSHKFSSVLSREEAKSRLGLSGKFVLGFAGFVRDWHGLDRVIEFLGVDKHPDQHLLLVGDGPARDGLLRRAEELGVADQFTITGIVSRDDVANYLAAFDIALQPNVVAYASPLKLFEYLALGHAIVAPSTDNILEILSDGDNALLFDSQSDEQMFDAIRRIRDDAELREGLAHGAQETIGRLGLTWDENANRVTRLFVRLDVGDDVQNAGPPSEP